MIATRTLFWQIFYWILKGLDDPPRPVALPEYKVKPPAPATLYLKLPPPRTKFWKVFFWFFKGLDDYPLAHC